MAQVVKQKYFVTAGSDSNTFALSSHKKNAYVTGFVSQNVIDYENNVNALPGPVNIFVAGFKGDGTQRFYKTAGSSSMDTVGFDVSADVDDDGVYATGVMAEPDFKDFKGIPRFGTANPWVAKLDKNGDQEFFVNPNIMMEGLSKVTHNAERIIMGTFFTGSGTDLESNPVNPSGKPAIALLGLNSNGNQKYFKYASASNLLNIVSSSFPKCPPKCSCSKSCKCSCKCFSKCKCSKPEDYGRENRVFAIGTLVIPEGDTAYDFDGEPIVGLVPLKPYAYLASLNNHGVQRYYKLAGENVIGNAITNQGNIIFAAGDLQTNANRTFSGLPIIADPNRTGVFVSRLEASGNEFFFKVAQGDLSAVSITSNKKGVFLVARVGPTNTPITDFNGAVVIPAIPASMSPWTLVAGLSHTGQQQFFVLCSGNPTSIDCSEEAIFLTGGVSSTVGARDFNNDLILNLQGSEDIYVAALNFEGQQQFFVTAGGSSDEIGNAISAYKKRAFVTGSIKPVAVDFEGNVINPKGVDPNNFVSSLKLVS